MRWVPAYVGIGSNQGDPARQVREAALALDSLTETRLVAVSSSYASAPLGDVPQPDFVNAVAAILTRLPPERLLAALKAQERAAGRQIGGPRWGPRPLDLDVLVYGAQRIATADLTVPHPGIALRNFVLLPLGELAPDLDVPGLGRVASLPVDVAQPRITRLETEGQPLDSQPLPHAR